MKKYMSLRKSLSIPENLFDKVLEHCRKKQIPYSQFICECIREYFDRKSETQY